MFVNKKAYGFTIIELMIATSVFTVILLLSATTLIQISRMYQKGVVTNQTQEVARKVMNQITEHVQFDSGVINSSVSNNICIGDKTYTFIFNRKLNDTATDYLKETKNSLNFNHNGCVPLSDVNNFQSDSSIAGDELLDPNMQILDLTIVPAVAGSTTIYKIDLTIAYGDNDLINLGSPNTCKALALGGSYCAIVDLSTTVQRRVR